MDKYNKLLNKKYNISKFNFNNSKNISKFTLLSNKSNKYNYSEDKFLKNINSKKNINKRKKNLNKKCKKENEELDINNKELNTVNVSISKNKRSRKYNYFPIGEKHLNEINN